MDPYEILGVSPDAQDETIRGAYLELVKQFSPDRKPEKFKTINRAYEQIKDEKSRLEYYLFDRDIPAETPFQVFTEHSMRFGKREPLDFDTLKEFLRKCAKS